jgi:hypothetical protein
VGRRDRSTSRKSLADRPISTLVLFGVRRFIGDTVDESRIKAVSVAPARSPTCAIHAADICVSKLQHRAGKHSASYRARFIEMSASASAELSQCCVIKVRARTQLPG